MKKSLRELYPEIAKQWDYDKNEKLPSEYTPGSNMSVYWKCDVCGYEWKSKISNRTKLNRGCPCCAGLAKVAGINDLATTHPQIAKEWDYDKNGDLTPQMVSYGERRKVYWLCPYGHSYKAAINHRTTPSMPTGCPVCNRGRQTSFAEQAFYYYVKKLYPDAVNRYTDIFNNGMELDIYIPSIKFGIEYDGQAWHKKDSRNKEKRKYQICQQNGIKLLRLKEKSSDDYWGTADKFLGLDDMYKPQNLEVAINQLLDEIDPKSNMWTRKYVRDTHSSIRANIERDRFEIQSFMTPLTDGKSFADVYPEIAKEWDDEKNGTLKPNMIKPYSDIKVWWKCTVCGFEYESTVGHRAYGTGCPKCANKKSALAKSISIDMINPETDEIIKTFVSASEAGRQMKINVSNIVTVCKGGREKAGGYKWQYHK